MNPWHLAWGTHVENLDMDNLSSLLRQISPEVPATVHAGLRHVHDAAITMDMLCMHQLVSEAIKVSGDVHTPSFWRHAAQTNDLAAVHLYVADFHAFCRGNQAAT
jgi:thiazole synthase ThiGH ThiG subunit